MWLIEWWLDIDWEKTGILVAAVTGIGTLAIALWELWRRNRVIPSALLRASHIKTGIRTDTGETDDHTIRLTNMGSEPIIFLALDVSGARPVATDNKLPEPVLGSGQSAQFKIAPTDLSKVWLAASFMTVSNRRAMFMRWLPLQHQEPLHSLVDEQRSQIPPRWRLLARRQWKSLPVGPSGRSTAKLRLIPSMPSKSIPTWGHFEEGEKRVPLL